MSKSAAQDHVKERKRGRKDASFMAMLPAFQRIRRLVFVLFFPTLTHSLSLSPSVILIRLTWAGAWLQPIINRLTLKSWQCLQSSARWFCMRWSVPAPELCFAYFTLTSSLPFVLLPLEIPCCWMSAFTDVLQSPALWIAWNSNPDLVQLNNLMTFLSLWPRWGNKLQSWKVSYKWW